MLNIGLSKNGKEQIRIAKCLEKYFFFQQIILQPNNLTFKSKNDKQIKLPVYCHYYSFNLVIVVLIFFQHNTMPIEFFLFCKYYLSTLKNSINCSNFKGCELNAHPLKIEQCFGFRAKGIYSIETASITAKYVGTYIYHK